MHFAIDKCIHRHQNNWWFTMNSKKYTNNLISENILSFHQFNRRPMSSWTVNCFDVYDALYFKIIPKYQQKIIWLHSHHLHCFRPWWIFSSFLMALMRTVTSSGTLTEAEYGHFTPGLSCMGTRERQWMAWHCENRYGCTPSAVCSGTSHCRAVDSLLVS